ncbi:hypothetical protein CGCF413_v010260 [Colletotrichum fructicola]|nr:hypothetical protein CGCF413_v010260 [Colletotrichum fructicola]
MTSTLQVQPSESLVGPLRDKEGFFKVQPSKNDLLLAEPAPTLEGRTCIAGTYRRWEAFRDVGGQRERVLVRSVSRAGRAGQPPTFDYLVVGSFQLFRGVICRLRGKKHTAAAHDSLSMRTNVGVDAVGLRVVVLRKVIAQCLSALSQDHLRNSSVSIIAGYGVDYLSVLLAAYVVVDVQDAFVRLANVQRVTKMRCVCSKQEPADTHFLGAALMDFVRPNANELVLVGLRLPWEYLLEPFGLPGDDFLRRQPGDVSYT